MITEGYYHEEICKEFTKVEGYKNAILDTTQMYVLHHRKETHEFVNGAWLEREVHIRAEQLKAENDYYNVPPSELIWLPKSEHQRLHQLGKNNSVAGKPSKRRRQVRCIETNQIFESIMEAAKWCGGDFRLIHRVCMKYKFDGANKKYTRKTHKGYHWEFV